MSQYAIEIEHLGLAYGRHQVLSGLDWRVPGGAVVGLLGRNGAGKTTLIECIVGNLRHSGSIRVLGEDSRHLSAATKGRIGLVPQQSDHLDWMTVRQVLDFVGAFYRGWRREWVFDLATRWQLPLDQRTDTLSLGQRQKLAIIRALGHDPELLILDEPVATLDPVARRAFLAELVEFVFVGDREKTIVFSSHITSDLERLVSHVAVLRDGTIARWDALDEIKERLVRLRLQAEAVLPDDLGIPGTLRVQHEGTRVLAVTDAFEPALVAELERRHDARVSVETLSLEDLYLELDA